MQPGIVRTIGGTGAIDGEGNMRKAKVTWHVSALITRTMRIIAITALAGGLLAGCSSSRTTRTNVGVGISKTSGQKAKVNIGASRNVGGNVNVGVSTSR